ncbi:MAG: hypothetical protein ACKE9I_07285 [Methylophagaceae bacterium]
MATWYSLDIDNEQTAKSTIPKIMDAFMPKYIGSGRPLGMAVFSSSNLESTSVTIYFSPKAASLAMQFGASSCQSDFADIDLSLLVGDEGSIDYLFPQTISE